MAKDEWDDLEEWPDHSAAIKRLLEKFGLAKFAQSDVLVSQALRLLSDQKVDRATRWKRFQTFVDRFRSRPIPHPTPPPKLHDQIERLRVESRLTIEDLAEAIELTPRSVSRHLAGEAVPRLRQIAAYERVFTRKLGKAIHLPNVSPNVSQKSASPTEKSAKRQPNVKRH
jgi:DNA-binding transcriptional ArsR family regulator